jgi:hypothetical protein
VPVAAVAEIVENSVALINAEAREAVAPVNVCLAVNDCAIPSPATVALDAGNVIVVASVPAKVSVLLAVKVLPSAIVRVALVAGAVIATLFTEVAVATPNTGVTKVGLVDNTTAVVPVDAVTPVPPLATGKVPVTFVVKFVNVVEVVPVPPLAIGSVPVTPVVRGNPVKFVAVPEVGVPNIGVTKVGEVANTKLPVPVSSVTALIKLALEGVAKKVATPVPNPLTPVEIGSPVALVSVAEAGVPRAIALPLASA